MCRENPPAIPLRLKENGTSLRVQGELPVVAVPQAAWRNIPACAGRTFPDFDRWLRQSEHPCVCRENFWRRQCRGEDRGTSLRVQGELIRIQPLFAYTRNIPACAGRTFTKGLKHVLQQEHPCVCRENDWSVF